MLYSPSVRPTSTSFQKARLRFRLQQELVARQALLDRNVGLGLGEFDHASSAA